MGLETVCVCVSMFMNAIIPLILLIFQLRPKAENKDTKFLCLAQSCQ